MSTILKIGTKPIVQVLVNQGALGVCSSRTFFGNFGKKGGKEIRFPKDLDHATGEERLVRLAIEKGIKDPFDLQPQVRGPGTKENPNIVQSFEGRRMIGCKCEEESSLIKYMWVYDNEPKRCECGHWYKAVPARKFWEEVAEK